MYSDKGRATKGLWATAPAYPKILEDMFCSFQLKLQTNSVILVGLIISLI